MRRKAMAARIARATERWAKQRRGLLAQELKECAFCGEKLAPMVAAHPILSEDELPGTAFAIEAARTTPICKPCYDVAEQMKFRVSGTTFAASRLVTGIRAARASIPAKGPWAIWACNGSLWLIVYERAPAHRYFSDKLTYQRALAIHKEERRHKRIAFEQTIIGKRR